MKQYLIKQRKPFIIAVLAGWLNVVAIYFANIKIAEVIDLIQAKDRSRLLMTVALSLALLGVALGLAYLSNYASFHFSTEITAQLRLDYLTSLYRRPTAQYLQRSRSEYVTDIDANMNQLRLDYLSVMPEAVIGIGQAVIYIVGLWYLHPFIFLSTLAFTVLPSLVSKSFGKKLSALNLHTSNCNEQHTTKLYEVLDGYLVIKQSKQRKNFLQDYHRTDQALLQAKKTYNITARLFNEAMFTLNNLSSLVVILIASLLVGFGQMPMSRLVASLAVVSISTNAIASAFRYAMQLMAGRSLKDKVLQVLQAEKAKEAIGVGQPPQLGISLDQVGYAFAEKEVFSGLSGQIEQGRSYAVIGESGAGKSTLAKILMKINADYRGSIRFSNGELADFTEDELYQSLYYIPQQPMIFRDTIKNNILMHTSGISDQEYEAVLQNVRLEKLAAAKGQAVIESNELSGGEMKRIELARALIRKAELIIFDEPTAGLDPQNAEAVEELLFTLKNIIVITHHQDEEYLRRFDEVIRL